MIPPKQQDDNFCFCEFFEKEDLVPHPRRDRLQDDKIAKFWLEPVRLQYSGGINRMEISRIQKIIQEHQRQLLEGWHEYFGR